MAVALNMLVNLPIIMTACGIFSIATSVIIILILAIYNNVIQEKDSIIQYSEVPS